MTKRNTTKVLSKTDFFKQKKELLFVEELGGSVWVKELSGRSLLKFKEKLEELEKINPEMEMSDSLELMALLVAAAVVDENGNPMFTEDDAQKLADINMNALVKLSNKVMELSGFPSDEAKDKTKNSVTPDASTTE